VNHTRLPMMAGNWKMNLNHLESIAVVQRLAFTLNDADYEAVEVVLLPPYTDIRSVQTVIDGDGYRLRYGAQDLSAHEAGAFTGEISGAMLAKLGCSVVVVGHSERRLYHHESDETVNVKVRAALRHSLTPIICVGEGLDVRREGEQIPYTLAQLAGSLAGRSSEEVTKTVIAYEPIWAIGTGEVATPEDAQEVCSAIRGWLASEHGADVSGAVRVLYGGSVKSENIAGIMVQPDVDGALIGGASLDPDEFVGIVRYRMHGDA
jgi:triosephosphate isomerase